MNISSFISYISNIKRSIFAGHGPGSSVYSIIIMAEDLSSNSVEIEKLIEICILCQHYISRKKISHKDISVISDIRQKAIRVLEDIIIKNTDKRLENSWGPRPLYIAEMFTLEKLPQHSTYVSVIYNSWLNARKNNALNQDFSYWFDNTWLPEEVSKQGIGQLLFKLKENIVYLNQKQRSNYQVKISNGLLHYKNGALVDTSKFISFNKLDTPLGIFIISTDVKLYISSHSKDFRHSSFVSGGPVYCAGEIGVKQGVIQCISRISGHYRPDAKSLYRMLHLLSSHDVNIKPIKVHFVINMPSHYVYGDAFYKNPEQYCQ